MSVHPLPRSHPTPPPAQQPSPRTRHALARRYGNRKDIPTPPGLPNSSKGSAVDLSEEGWYVATAHPSRGLQPVHLLCNLRRDYAFEIGIKSHFLAAKHAVPVMEKAGGGSIVNISSVHGLLSARNNLASVPSSLL